MNPDYNTLLRFYKAATGASNMGLPNQQVYQSNVNPQVQGTTQNVLPPQTVIQVNGRESINALRMSPNSSVLLMDSKEPIVWLCTSDGIGNVTPVAYDIVLHQEVPPVDVKSLEARIDNIERVFTNFFGGIINGKSNDNTVESRENAIVVGESDEHKEEH